MLITIGLAINKRSVVKEKAKQFVDYMTSYQTQLHIRQHTLTLPAMRKATEWEGQESIYRPSRYFMFREIVPTYKQITELGLNNKQFIDIQLEIMLYVSGVHDIGAFCSRLEEILSNIEER
ncbi:hypothetical protein [Caldalkalibacillus mannanilyticus]|uniref:hypothetical protein n=1 Tax=Caldalkalibacillus mannanilyticus TaxID=1418 RepID=UPI00068502B9|nr:hypothetical protein [Caldalkalibacillus mannanilyticus]